MYVIIKLKQAVLFCCGCFLRYNLKKKIRKEKFDQIYDVSINTE